MHIAASLMTVMARPSCTTVRLFGASHCHVLPLHAALPNRRRVRWWCGPPGGGVGDRHLVTIPHGVVGDRLPWGGKRQGGGRVGEDELGARDKILNTKVARRARAGQTFPHRMTLSLQKALTAFFRAFLVLISPGDVGPGDVGVPCPVHALISRHMCPWTHTSSIECAIITAQLPLKVSLPDAASTSDPLCILVAICMRHTKLNSLLMPTSPFP